MTSFYGLLIKQYSLQKTRIKLQLSTADSESPPADCLYKNETPVGTGSPLSAAHEITIPLAAV